eukprot:NODE_820_length_1166_cov_384.873769_g576_i0.p1 GENE.NODE_820_length_1166_cov_384.873769_g576_i0~~NODE_820_length_1166_cov_384.873769_g576_i0.p1  ORF type:complete len:334 (+),score=118.24 NODE_820_length_1166_cov_384.873769_g576_i0:22-1002(+)
MGAEPGQADVFGDSLHHQASGGVKSEPRKRAWTMGGAGEAPVKEAKRSDAAGWDCQNRNCRHLNPEHRVMCERCQTHYWDWPCAACGHMNELRRKVCEECRKPRSSAQDKASRILVSSEPEFSSQAMHSYSKKLSKLLRHDARARDLPMRSDGYMLVDDVIALPEFRGVTLSALKTIANRDDKGRFKVKEGPDGVAMVRCNHGHSFEVPDLELEPIQLPSRAHPEPLPVLVHATFRHGWRVIREEGLNRMTRTHIHFAAEQGAGQFPGIRRNAEVLVYLDLERALRDGIEVYHCANNLCISPGINGIIPPKYFVKAIDLESGRQLR